MALPRLAERSKRRGMGRLFCLLKTMGTIINIFFWNFFS